ncbi:MAG: SDR family NAD(P)-dependent oxidoreductase [Halobacteriota archaeon]
MPDSDLEGLTALVTGSVRGLGRAIAITLADRNADVAIHYHTSEETAVSLAEDLGDRAGVETMAVGADVGDPSDVEEAFDAIEHTLDTVDLLVNNVGTFAPTHWQEITVDRWQSVMASNLTGTYLCSRRALDPMASNGFGRIVNIGYSGADRALVHPKNAPYFIAKTGVTMFTRMLAADTTDTDITANVVAPYVMENSETFPDDLPKGRPATFEEVVDAVCFFLDPATRYVSGQHLAVDGGWLPERV